MLFHVRIARLAANICCSFFIIVQLAKSDSGKVSVEVMWIDHPHCLLWDTVCLNELLKVSVDARRHIKSCADSASVSLSPFIIGILCCSHKDAGAFMRI